MRRITVLAALLGCATPSLATNLVANGSFETGTFSGWKQFANRGATFVSPRFATDGAYSAFFGPVGSEGGIKQDIATTAGHKYKLTFDLQNDGTLPNSERITFAGVDAFYAANEPIFPATSFSYIVAATAASSVLSFQFRQDPRYFYLDNISLVDIGPLPEPAAWAMMVSGFGVIGGALRRRASKPAHA